MILTLGPSIVFKIATQRLLFYLFDSTGFWFTCISNESINSQNPKVLDFTGQFVKTLQSFSFPMSLPGILALNVEDRGLVSPVGLNNRL